MEKPIEYEQYDPRWKNIMYSAIDDKSQTIGTAGCGPACAAMVVATLRKGETIITPVHACAYAVAKGFRSENNGTGWGFFEKFLGEYSIPCEQVGEESLSKVLTALKNGYMVIAVAGKGIWTTGGHFILAYGLSADGSKVYINDPNSEAGYRELANIPNFKNECIRFWIIEEEWNMPEIKNLQVVHSEKGLVEMKSVNVNGENYVRLRDTELIAPIEVGWNGKNPTVKVNYK